MQGVCGGHHVLRQLLRQPHARLIHKRMGPADLHAHDQGYQVAELLHDSWRVCMRRLSKACAACDLQVLRALDVLIQQQSPAPAVPWSATGNACITRRVICVASNCGGDGMAIERRAVNDTSRAPRASPAQYCCVAVAMLRRSAM